MDDSPQFSSGLELANFAVTSDLLLHSWTAIKNLYGQTGSNGPQSLPFHVGFGSYNLRRKCTIIAFVTSPICTKEHLQEGEGDLISSETLKQTFPVFDFLYSKSKPDFSINKLAITLFQSLYDDHERMTEITGFIENSTTPVIITGHSLGGSVASLFTLWLLGRINLATKKHPLCITFGSPLVGNEDFQKAILQFSTWNSCFLHIVSNCDPLPRIFLHQNPSFYTPFGTFLLSSESGCACYEDAQSILELFGVTKNEFAENQDPNEGLQFCDYEKMVRSLKHNAMCKAIVDVGRDSHPLQVCFIAELTAIGVIKEQPQQQQIVNFDHLIKRLEKDLKDMVNMKKKAFDPSEELNEIKKRMAQLEWYKKFCEKKNLGYYDSYKNMGNSSDIKVIGFKKRLTGYWKRMVEEVENKPQKEGIAFRTRWLFGGTNYRRMVEPLDIAEYYCDGKRDYLTQGRPHHYIKLEQWHYEEKKKPTRGPNNAKKKTVSSILTEDSCFWAHVEDALIACKLLKDNESGVEDKVLSRSKLIEFEDYVLGLIKNYAVSPEIFLQQSSFMKWWEDYDEIMGASYNSVLTGIMRSGEYENYTKGCLELR